MKYFSRIGFVCTFYLFILQLNMSGQTNTTNNCVDSLSKTNDYLYAMDDEIINGVFYSFPDKRIKGNPFFIDQNPKPGLIFNGGNTFKQFPMNYNIVEDKLIIKVENFHGTERFIAVNENQADSFLFGNTLFVNSRYITQSDNKINYYQQIYKSSYISLYKSYKKRFIDMYDEFSYPFGKFSEAETKMYVLKNNKLLNFSSVNHFIKCFEKEHGKEIKKYIRKNNIQFKNASNDVLSQMMSYCVMIISQKK